MEFFSFDEIRRLHTLISRVKDRDDFPILLVGNKADLLQERHVSNFWRFSNMSLLVWMRLNCSIIFVLHFFESIETCLVGVSSLIQLWVVVPSGVNQPLTIDARNLHQVFPLSASSIIYTYTCCSPRLCPSWSCLPNGGLRFPLFFGLETITKPRNSTPTSKRQ